MDLWDEPYISNPDKHVCSACVEDNYLREALKHASQPVECSYCGATPAAPLDVLLEMVSNAVGAEYADPANELPYETREGGYQGQVFDGYDVVMWELGVWTDCEKLAEDAAEAFSGQPLCRRDYFSLDAYEVLNGGWQGFVEQVKHRTRYLFLRQLHDEDVWSREEIPPGAMLDELGRLIEDVGLIRDLPAGTEIVRVRVADPDERPSSPRSLGSPPRDKATMPNRMSPPGIPMFYGALDETTAVVETFDPVLGMHKTIAIARFTAAQDLRLVDLTRLPPTPSQFDGQPPHPRKPIVFLHEFAEDLAKPIARDEKAHVEYVPTQIVTEYVRHGLTVDDARVDGLLYRSSKEAGDTALVLFIENEQCGPMDEDPGQEAPVVELKGVRFADPAEFRDAFPDRRKGFLESLESNWGLSRGACGPP